MVLLDLGRLVSTLPRVIWEQELCGLVIFASPSLPSTLEEMKIKSVLELIWDEKDHFDLFFLWLGEETLTVTPKCLVAKLSECSSSVTMVAVTRF